MRRREQARAVAGLTQHGVQHGGGGPFAFCAGDMDDAQTVLRIAQAREQSAHAIEFKVVRRRRVVFVIDKAVPERAGSLGGKSAGKKALHSLSFPFNRFTTTKA